MFHAWKDATNFVHSNEAFGWFFQIVIEFISKSNHIILKINQEIQIDTDEVAAVHSAFLKFKF